MTVRLTTRCLTIGASIALFCCFGVAQETARSGTVSVNSIVDALEKAQTDVRPQVSYQVIPEYRLFGANDSSANSDVVSLFAATRQQGLHDREVVGQRTRAASCTACSGPRGRSNIRRQSSPKRR